MLIARMSVSLRWIVLSGIRLDGIGRNKTSIGRRLIFFAFFLLFFQRFGRDTVFFQVFFFAASQHLIHHNRKRHQARQRKPHIKYSRHLRKRGLRNGADNQKQQTEKRRNPQAESGHQKHYRFCQSFHYKGYKRNNRPQSRLLLFRCGSRLRVYPIISVPIYLTSASGTVTVPSAF